MLLDLQTQVAAVVAAAPRTQKTPASGAVGVAGHCWQSQVRAGAGAGHRSQGLEGGCWAEAEEGSSSRRDWSGGATAVVGAEGAESWQWMAWRTEGAEAGHSWERPQGGRARAGAGHARGRQVGAGAGRALAAAAAAVAEEPEALR